MLYVDTRNRENINVIVHKRKVIFKYNDEAQNIDYNDITRVFLKKKRNIIKELILNPERNKMNQVLDFIESLNQEDFKKNNNNYARKKYYENRKDEINKMRREKYKDEHRNIDKDENILDKVYKRRDHAPDDIVLDDKKVELYDYRYVSIDTARKNITRSKAFDLFLEDNNFYGDDKKEMLKQGIIKCEQCGMKYFKFLQGDHRMGNYHTSHI